MHTCFFLVYFLFIIYVCVLMYMCTIIFIFLPLFLTGALSSLLLLQQCIIPPMRPIKDYLTISSSHTVSRSYCVQASYGVIINAFQLFIMTFIFFYFTYRSWNETKCKTGHQNKQSRPPLTPLSRDFRSPFKPHKASNGNFPVLYTPEPLLLHPSR